jgi:hypothetical protein
MTISDYLKTRAIDVTNNPDDFLKQQISVIPANEVFAVLEMVENGTFEEFIEKQKNDLPDKT